VAIKEAITEAPAVVAIKTPSTVTRTEVTLDSIGAVIEEAEAVDTRLVAATIKGHPALPRLDLTEMTITATEGSKREEATIASSSGSTLSLTRCLPQQLTMESKRSEDLALLLFSMSHTSCLNKVKIEHLLFLNLTIDPRGKLLLTTYSPMCIFDS